MSDPAAPAAWMFHALAWAAFVVACGAAALPLCARLFRALPDRGGFAAGAVGLLLPTWFAWLLSLENPEGWSAAGKVRALCLLAAAIACVPAWLATRRDASAHGRFAAWWPVALFAALGFLHLPHSGVVAWLGVACLATCSAAAWDRRRVRAAVRPFVLAQVVFLAGFAFFAFVRGFLPWAHWEPGYSAAEKFGNLMHLNSILRSDAMPPRDAWMFGLPTNYYYGGHLIVATVAKATGTPGGVAFNLGLATIVGLTLSGGFGLAANIVAAGRSRVLAMRTLAAGVAGALAIACFGNVDGLVQILSNGFHRVTFEHYDFWRSSRVIFSSSPGSSGAGTITEFPWFSAILGDLHPHHMALPFSLVLLGAFAQIHRASMRGVRTGAEWTRRCAVPTAVAAAMLGFLFPINIWDAVVFGPIMLGVVALSMKGTSWSGESLAGLRRLAFAGAGCAVVALLCNSAPDAIPMFGQPMGVATALAVLAAYWIIPSSPEFRRVMRWTVPVACGAIVFAGGWSTASAHAFGEGAAFAKLAIAARDAAAFGFAAGAAAMLAGKSTTMGPAFPAFVAWGAAGIVALAVASPFRAFFDSPIRPAQAMMASLLPPIPDRGLILDGTGIADRFWHRMVATPFEDYLRTKPGEVFVYWGLFLVPIFAGVAASLACAWRKSRSGGALLLLGGCAALFAWMFNELDSTTAPLAAIAAIAFACVAWRARRRSDAVVAMLLAGAAAVLVFVETLHFDDNYAGDYERYNTPFKMLYPCWAVLAAGMVGSFARFGHGASRRVGPVGGAVATALLFAPVAVAGLAYPIASTITRTRAFGAFPPRSTLEQNHPYSLDATAWPLYSNDPALAADARIVGWLRENAEKGAAILEAPAPPDRQSYTYHGRFAAMTGLPGLGGWPHHEMQWRGWGTPVPAHVAVRFVRYTTTWEMGLPEPDEVVRPLLDDPEFSASLKQIAVLPEPEEALRSLADLADEDRTHLAAWMRAPRERSFTWLALADVARAHATAILTAREWDGATKALLRLYGIRYVAIGSLEREMLAGNDDAMAKFDGLERVFQDGEFAVYRVPDAMMEEATP